MRTPGKQFSRPRAAHAIGLLLSLVATLPTAGQAEDFTYITNAGAITITGYTGPGGAVTIPDSTNGLPVASIGSSAFLNKSSVTSVTIPNSVTNIGDGAFFYCTSLKSVALGSNVLDIGNLAFQSCSKLTSVALPNSVSRIGDCAFYSCVGLSNVAIGSNVLDIGNYAFQSCSKMASLTIPSLVTNIGDYAFAACSSLTNVTMGNNVRIIGNSAFWACTRLMSVTIPQSVVSIGSLAFRNCSSLPAITVDAPNLVYSSVNGVLFDASQTVLIQYPGGKAGGYAVPSSVTTLACASFQGCAGLTNVVIPNSVTSIGDSAFSGCSSLADLRIPDSVTGSIGGFTTGLKNITIGNGVTSIEHNAFFNCTSLTNVTVGNSVTNIGDYAFNGCLSLGSVFFQGCAPSLGVSPFCPDDATVYYLPGTTGWNSTFGGLPTLLWNPQIQICDGSLSVRTNGFGFNIVGTTNIPVVVEACANLAIPVWIPLQSCTVTDGSVYFGDPDWTNYPGRFYRLRSP